MKIYFDEKRNTFVLGNKTLIYFYNRRGTYQGWSYVKWWTGDLSYVGRL
jgi:hypothetical protein